MESAVTGLPVRVVTAIFCSLRPDASVRRTGGRLALSDLSPHCMRATRAGSMSRPLSVRM